MLTLRTSRCVGGAPELVLNEWERMELKGWSDYVHLLLNFILVLPIWHRLYNQTWNEKYIIFFLFVFVFLYREGDFVCKTLVYIKQNTNKKKKESWMQLQNLIDWVVFIPVHNNQSPEMVLIYRTVAFCLISLWDFLLSVHYRARALCRKV